MEDQYGIADLRQFLEGRPLFPQPPDLLSTHRAPIPHPFDMLLFRSDSTSNAAAVAGGVGDGAAGRWPRQETLTLLEIRSKMDPRFKEANQKGPLWDEVSRIMSEEHGYQRSGKKCREKFENLYKYYKKTKEGKAGRQDGKHYRFFRQLEALYGDSSNNNSSFQAPKISETSLSFSNYSNTTSSDDNEKNYEGWELKIRDSIDAQMKKLMDKQEACMAKMMTTMEQNEQERMMREEEWRKQDADRIEREHTFWANERAWIESRDAALMEALHKLTGKEVIHSQNDDVSQTVWAAKMGNFGNDRSALMCKDKHNNYLLKCNKKRKDQDSKSCGSLYYHHHRHDQEVGGEVYSCDTIRVHDQASNSSPNAAMATDNCIRYFMGDAYGRMMP